MATESLKSVSSTSNMDTGIKKTDRSEVAKALSQALSDSFTLYVKTLGVHWNVVGANFYSVHKLTEAQYEDLDAAIDVMAERIRALGHLSPASFSEFSSNAQIKSEAPGNTAEEMIQSLITDNEAAAKRMRDFVSIADEADDVFTADMLTERIGQHEENAWMLRSMIA